MKLRQLVYDQRNYMFYRYQESQGSGSADSNITVYGDYESIPSEFLPVVLPGRLFNSMYYRLKRGRARLLCYSEDGKTLQSYGWVQSWQPFRRRFKVLADDGTVLGPYWTAPEHRGKGLYGKVLQHSLLLCPKETPILIFTTRSNSASQRGIAKAGFEYIGDWTITAIFRGFICARQTASANIIGSYSTPGSDAPFKAE